MKKIRRKIGSSLELGCSYKDSDGTPKSLVGVEVRSELRDPLGALTAVCSFEPVDLASGLYVLKIPFSETSTFKEQEYKMDIRYTHDYSRRFTETLVIEFYKSQTRLQ
jgi:hypothetical protein